jgi:predicted RNA binding protein YcfA (HicA-like mRNA interferase family)
MVKRQDGTSHRTLERAGWPDYVFAFHDAEEIGPQMLSRIAKRTGLKPEDL